MNERMEPQPTRRTVGRLAALLLAGSGALGAATLPLPQAAGADRRAVLVIVLAAIAVGIIAFFAPWQRLGSRASLVLLPIAFMLAAAANFYTNGQPYTYGVFFIVAFVWVGLAHTRWTSLWFLPPAAVAYVTPLLVRAHHFGPAPASAALLIPVCGLVAESIARERERERRSRDRTAALGRIALALGQLDVDRLSAAIAHEMRTMLRAEQAVFFLVSARTIQKTHVAGFSEEEAKAVSALEGAELTDALDGLVSGNPVVVDDSRTASFPLLDPVGLGLRSYLVVPVMVAGELRGILACAERTRARRYDTDDVTSALALAAQASAALRNALLYARTLEAARSDDLTLLGNRRAFHEQLDTEVERARRYGRKLSLLVVDVDELKVINDAWGHQAGDEVLMRVSQLIKNGCRRSDGVYRIGGDEFALILPETSVDNASIVAERVRRSVERGGLAREHERDLTVSVGLSSFPEHGISTDELFERADSALYEVKRAGRNAVCTATTREPSGPGVRFGIDIPALIEERRLVTAYQPLVSLETGNIVAYEAFCRLDPAYGSAPTSTLFRAAASLGLTEQLDRCCRAKALGGAEGLEDSLMLFLNTSAAALASPEFDLEDLLQTIRRAGLNARQVVIEVTDHERSVGTLLVHNLSACQEEGLRLSLDDFGDTTTDLSVLASLPFDFVKIDMGVIRGDEDVRRRLILGLLVVAREIGARLLAEGVETRDELRLVTELGFEAAQGYFIKDPGPSPLLPAHVELIPAS